MQPEGSSPYSQEPATCPCPESDRSSPCTHPTSRRSILILSFHILVGLPSVLLLSGFPTKTLYATLLFNIRATCPSHLSYPHLITRIISGEEYRTYSSLLCSLLHSLITSSLLGPNIPLSILFSKTLSLLSSLNVNDQVSHPYKTTGRIIVLYILIFIHFWTTNWKTKDSTPNDSKHSLISVCS